MNIPKELILVLKEALNCQIVYTDDLPFESYWSIQYNNIEAGILGYDRTFGYYIYTTKIQLMSRTTNILYNCKDILIDKTTGYYIYFMYLPDLKDIDI